MKRKQEEEDEDIRVAKALQRKFDNGTCVFLCLCVCVSVCALVCVLIICLCVCMYGCMCVCECVSNRDAPAGAAGAAGLEGRTRPPKTI